MDGGAKPIEIDTYNVHTLKTSHSTEWHKNIAWSMNAHTKRRQDEFLDHLCMVLLHTQYEHL